MAGCFLHVAQRDACVEGSGDEGVPQGVRADRLFDPGAFGDAAHDSCGAVSIEALPVGAQEDRAVQSFTDRQTRLRAVRGASGMVTIFPPLRSTVRMR